MLLDPIALGTGRAPNRLLFGPHVTNLGDGRALSPRHVAYYERRARGGCGTIVVEEASVHESDWPYERAPSAARCQPGWAAIAEACHGHGTLAIAAIGHSGGQGSSAYSQRELWAPSRVPEVASREVPKWMEPDDIAAVVDGFADAARLAVDAGMDGVEVNAGQHSLIRQFLSGLTNHRTDEWGTDRLQFARQAIDAARTGTGRRAGVIVGLRLSCDELAPWAGITPEHALDVVRALSPLVDYLVVVRGSIFSVDKTRADLHEPATFNLELCRAMKAVSVAPVVLQGSVVDAGVADRAIGDGACDLVEMTRAQIADADLGAKLRRAPAPVGPVDRTHDGEAIRPCLRCNQTCQVRDARNPIVTCVVDPSSGHELDDPPWYPSHPPAGGRDVVVVGGGIAGMEAARVAARRGHHVHLMERDDRLGGVAAVAGPAAPFVAWLTTELDRLGVRVTIGAGAAGVAAAVATAGAGAVVQATGSRPGTATYDIEPGATVLDIAAVRAGRVTLPATGPVVLHDPIGGPIAVELATELGDRAVLVTPDQVAGNELSRTGDLAPANVRLAQRNVAVVRRAILRSVGTDHVVVRDRFSGEERRLPAAAVVDCGFRLPDDPLPGVERRAGDCVAPRTVLEAVLDARRAAASL